MKVKKEVVEDAKKKEGSSSSVEEEEHLTLLHFMDNLSAAHVVGYSELVDVVDGLDGVVDVLLTGVDDTADHDQLLGRVVLDDEGERAVSLHHLLTAHHQVVAAAEHVVERGVVVHVFVLEVQTAQLVDLVPLVEFVVLVPLVVIVVQQLLVVDDVVEAVHVVDVVQLSGGGDAVFRDLDRALVDEFVQVHFLVTAEHASAVLVSEEEVVVVVVQGFVVQVVLDFRDGGLANAGDAGEVGAQRVEAVGDALLLQGAASVDLVLDLEFGHLNGNLAHVTVGLFQDLFQLHVVLQVQFLHSGQAVLVFRHYQVHGQLVLLGRDTDDLDQLVFVVLELADGFHNLDDLHFVRFQREELGLLGDVVAHLTSPWGFHFQSVDQDHFGVVGDRVAGHDLVDFHVRLLRDPVVDHFTARLGLVVEVAVFDLAAGLGLTDQLDEQLLGGRALVDGDQGDRVDAGGGERRLAENVVDDVVVAVETASQLLGQQFEHAFLRVRVSLGAGDAVDLAFGVSAGSLVQGGQGQLDGQRRDDGVLVIFVFLRLLVQLGGQFHVRVVDILDRGETVLLFVSAQQNVAAAAEHIVEVDDVVVDIVHVVVDVVVQLAQHRALLTTGVQPTLAAAEQVVVTDAVVDVVVVVVVQRQVVVEVTVQVVLVQQDVVVVVAVHVVVEVVVPQTFPQAVRLLLQFLQLLLLVQVQQLLEAVLVQVGASQGDAQSDENEATHLSVGYVP